MRRTIYLSKLRGLDKKVRVAFDWTSDLLFPKDCALYTTCHAVAIPIVAPTNNGVSSTDIKLLGANKLPDLAETMEAVDEVHTARKKPLKRRAATMLCPSEWRERITPRFRKSANTVTRIRCPIADPANLLH